MCCAGLPTPLTELVQEVLKDGLLFRLRFVVGGPLLAVGLARDLDRFRRGGSGRAPRVRRGGDGLRLLYHVLDGEQVFARLASKVEVGARAASALGVYLVAALAGLRRDYVETAFAGDVAAVGYLKTLLLSDAH